MLVISAYQYFSFCIYVFTALFMVAWQHGDLMIPLSFPEIMGSVHLNQPLALLLLAH